MKVLWVVLKKEFLQLLRNPLVLIIILCCPVIILGIIPHAMGHEPRIRLIWIDRDDTPVSRKIGYLLNLSPNIEEMIIGYTMEQALAIMEKGEADILFQIPFGFGKQLEKGEPLPIYMAVDGTHTISTHVHLYYLTEIIRGGMPDVSFCDMQVYPLFNESSENRHYFIVSLLVILMTILGISLAALSLITEKTNGILEQLHSTVMSWHTYLGGKIIFFVTFCLFELLIGLLICRIYYGFEVRGNLLDFIILASVFQATTVGLGLLIASLTKTPLQAAYLTIFLLLTLVLLSTMFSPLHSMPIWAQALRFINPLYMMLDASRLIALKGFALQQVVPQLAMLTLQGTILTVIAVWRLKRV